MNTEGPPNAHLGRAANRGMRPQGGEGGGGGGEEEEEEEEE